jgi:hypothetical protein
MEKGSFNDSTVDVAERTKGFAPRAALAALVLGIAAIPLWMLSYVWIPFRFAGYETETVWSVVIASEIGAMITGLLAIILGVVSRRYTQRGGGESRRATLAIKLGVGVWICLVVFNLIGIVFFT